MGVALLATVTAASEAGNPFNYIRQVGSSGGIEPQAGRWTTWVLGSASDVLPPPPPADNSAQTAAELAQLRQLQAQRSDIAITSVHYWNMGPATQRWTDLTLSLIQRDKINPVRAARILACVHTAMSDAAVATWNAKYTYGRRPPSKLDPGIQPVVAVTNTPSYPCEHAALAGAAAMVLTAMFPNDTATFSGMEKDDCQSRLMAGTNYPSDISAGLTLGTMVGQKAVSRAASDGSTAVYTGTVPTGPGFWQGTNPVEPLAGTWKTWILTSGSQLRPGPPPTFGSAQFQTELAEVKSVSSNATPTQRAIALFWADGAGTVTPPGHWFQIASTLIARDNLNTPRAARILGLLGATVEDAAISCWDCKFTYWFIRPNQADPSIVTIVPTPNFPSYTSGHSTFSGASSEVLAHFFPKDADQLRSMAQEAAMSRLYAGIHYRTDNETGLKVGQQLAALSIDRDQVNGP
jgi:membrane-associated phospholipid phosphatase